MQTADVLKATESLNTLYSSFFNTLITIVTVLIGVIGIGLPLLITWYQNRRLAFETEKIKSAVIEDLREQVNEILRKELQEVRTTIDRRFKEAAGANCHFQANKYHDDKQFAEALVNYAIAGFCYLESINLLSFQRLVRDLLACAEQAFQGDLKLERHHSRDIQKFIVRIKRHNAENGNVFLDLYNEITMHYDKLVPYPVDEREFAG